jgi:hypothetical protein
MEQAKLRVLQSEQKQDRPHLLVTIVFTGTDYQRVIRCWNLMFNASHFALTDENDEPIFFSNRSICDVTEVKPIE